jgi:hypothetical protein
MYDRNRSFIILATVITIINYDHRSFIVQTTELVDLVLVSVQPEPHLLERHDARKPGADRRAVIRRVPHRLDERSRRRDEKFDGRRVGF